jgi:hypothetical protein
VDPVLKDALIRLARIALTAGIVAAIGAILKVGTAGDPVTLLHIVIGAFATGAIAALMEYLRTVTSPDVPVTPVVPVGPTPVTAPAPKRAGALQLRAKNVFDYFPI